MPSAFIIINQTTTMKKKRITYGVNGMMEYQAIIKIGRATLKVMFTDGSMTSIGQNPAKYTTSDFLVQHAIENSSDFKRGRITVVNTIELDEDVHIERNPEKPSTQQAQVAKKAVAEDKPNDASLSLSKPVAEDDVLSGKADEPTDDANAGDAEETKDETPADTEDTSTDTTEEEVTDDATEETATAEGKTEVEFTDNQEAKDYLLKNFGVKPGTMRNRDDIKAIGLTYGVTITFANENK